MKPTQPVRVHLGTFELDLRSGELCTNDQKTVLQEQPLQILRMLVDREGELVGREEIRKKLWPNDTIVEFDHSINAAIKNLRRALGDSADQPKYIETVARRGYRLMVPVEPARTDEPPGEIPARVGGDAVLQPEPSLIGKKVSHYRVLEVIGAGGMGLVYKAEDLKLGRQVALKFLPEELVTEPAALQRFEREAQTASSLNHPNICTIYEVEEHEARPFIVMELLEGETLRDRLTHAAGTRQQVLPLDQLLDVAIQVCYGLQAAHEKGIIHRDIKPANIFLTTAGQAKILDFGLAKAMAGASFELRSQAKPASLAAEVKISGVSGASKPATSDPTLTRTGLAVGTAGYMSPEQLRGENFDARTDIFSFGLVLYEMATGNRAITGETATSVQDGILQREVVPIHQVRSSIPAKLDAVITKALEKDRRRRYQSAEEMNADLKLARATAKPRDRRLVVLVGAALVCVALIAVGLYWHPRKSVRLNRQDAIVIADFDNQTGDSVFDDALKQGMAVQLSQSPFLEVTSDQRVSETLRLMGRSVADRLTLEVGREVCQRTASTAVLTGSVMVKGGQYIIGLKAFSCTTGDLLAEVQEQAANKAAVIKALDNAAIELRRQLGESLNSVETYSTPLAQASTPSLEALKAYSMALKTTNTQGFNASLPLYKRAVELDSDFAMPYAVMAGVYDSLNEPEQAAANARLAYEHRRKVSERERLSIELSYYLYATGELDKAAQAAEALQQIYPRDYGQMALGYIFVLLGDHERALQHEREALRLEPDNEVNYLNLGATYTALNLLDETENVYRQSEERKLQGEYLLAGRYQLAFLRGDRATMSKLVSAAKGKPGTEELLLLEEAQTSTWDGRFRNAHRLFQQAIDAARRNSTNEAAAMYLALGALSEVDCAASRQVGDNAFSIAARAPNRDVRAVVALAEACHGNVTAAEKLVQELDGQFPLDTLIQKYWLPTIRSAIALQRSDAHRAVTESQLTAAMTLSQPMNLGIAMCPTYIRGQALLALRDGKGAAAEFRRFIDHYGLVGNFSWGALARLGLARSYALDAQTDPAAREKARTAYQNFLTLWKDADPDIPIYKQAKAEYAKLQ